jgi:hypothetical protein
MEEGFTLQLDKVATKYGIKGNEQFFSIKSKWEELYI